MKPNFCIALLFVVMAGITSMVTQPVAAADREPAAIVPLPAKIEWLKGHVELNGSTQIMLYNDLPRDEAETFAELLRPATGLSLRLAAPSPKPRNVIALFLVPNALAELGSEGYRLEVGTTDPIVVIAAATPAGLYYGGQTLRQLLPPSIYAKTKQPSVTWTIPCCKIEDKPRFPWRGLLLDECRHFFGKDFVKRTIDLLAIHKLNTLHWHLTEDQGWRIEIKKYPRLTELGAWRNETTGDGKRYGGFYTQDDIREIVAYAAKRHVTIVPEIEMPGHALAALAAYPQFSCTGGPFKVRTVWGVEKDVYCAGNDSTFDFLRDVLDEVTGLFPSTYIHIGGDECPKDRWKQCPKCQARLKAEGLRNERELQSYFIRKIEEHLASKGRRLVGWDEILEGGLPPKATVMSWRGMDGAVAAADSGHDYVASPTSHCYLDYSYASISLENAYSFEPAPAALPADQRSHCLGVQGNLWSEHTPNPADVDRQVWPRLCALAEVGWSPKELRDWSHFGARMQTHATRLGQFGIKVDLTARSRPALLSTPAR